MQQLYQEIVQVVHIQMLISRRLANESRQICPLLSVSPSFFGSFEAEADIDIVWLELIVEVNNWIERLFYGNRANLR